MNADNPDRKRPVTVDQAVWALQSTLDLLRAHADDGGEDTVDFGQVEIWLDHNLCNAVMGDVQGQRARYELT